MNKDLQASQSIIINSTPSHVWDAMTNPEKIKQYLHGTKTTTDWKIGSPIKFEGEYNGQTYSDKGNVIENKENELISYNYWSGFSGLSDNPENYCIVTYKIEEIGPSEVKLTWKQQGFASEEGKCHTETGLVAMLEQIKQMVEQEN